jgi:inositol transport system substrate-binding protein
MKRVSVLVLSLALVLSFAVSTTVGAQKKVVKVAYIAKNTVDAFHATLNGAAKPALDALVKKGTIKSWQLFDGLTDPMTQVSLIEDAINTGANFVIMLPAESQGSAPVVTRCKEAGIPIIVVNSQTNNTAEMATAFVGSDDVQAGEMMANYVVAQLPAGGMYAHMMGIVGNSAQQQRGQGIGNVMGKNSKWKSVGDYAADWSADKAVQFTTDVLTQYADKVKAIICDNDDMSSAVQAYCNSVGRKDIVCIGVDGNAGPLAMVKAGTLKATVLQDGAAQVRAAIALIPDVLAGKSVKKVTMVPFTLVTSKNVDQYLK